MLMRLKHDPIIDNPRHYSKESVEKLRRLLIQGAPAVADSHRKDFYEVEDGDRVFYVHLAPNGNIWLLATWLKSQPEAPVPRNQLVQPACTSC